MSAAPAIARLLILPHPCFRKPAKQSPALDSCTIIPFPGKRLVSMRERLPVENGKIVLSLPWASDLYDDTEVTD
jgi:hypothetical protein